jgi:hypothetical protein
MAIPYKVKVTSNGANDIKVTVNPQPVVTNEDYTKVVAGRFQRALMSEDVRNTIFGRARLKSELEEILTDFHKQGLIKVREDNDAN